MYIYIHIIQVPHLILTMAVHTWNDAKMDTSQAAVSAYTWHHQPILHVLSGILCQGAHTHNNNIPMYMYM